MVPGAFDPKARLAAMDEAGLWAQVVYPNVGGFGSQRFQAMPDPALRIACVRAYNDWLAEWCSTDPARLLGAMSIPFWDIDETVAEIERGAALDHRCIIFTGEPQRWGLPFFSDEHWDPLWQAAVDTGLSVSFHLGSGDMESHLRSPRIQVQGGEYAAALTGIALFLENAHQVTDFLMSGVLPRFPELKVVSVESGAGWVPFVLDSVDRAFEHFELHKRFPQYEDKPSEYFRRQMSACFLGDEFISNELLDRVGERSLMFETDFPHPLSLHGDLTELTDRALREQSADRRHLLTWQNAADLYRVEAPSRDRRAEPVAV
jgi:predicted TIM-barrel fold metal-dependent hydrolase